MFDWLSDLVDQFLEFILSLLPSLTEPFDKIISLLPPSLSYLFYLSATEVVVPMILAAYITRFVIRRIPFVG